MSAIHFDQLAFSYSTAVTLFADVTMSLGSGWTGLVGANGAGKTTLLRLIGGSVRPSRGEVRLDPSRALVAHCPQTADHIDANIEVLASAWDGDAQGLIGRLGLQRDQLERWATLSPGERKRWQVGGALYRNPDILLLDEPTNHLDEEARSLLLDTLRRFKGAGVVVSHDRTVLGQLCQRILRIERGTAQLWRGGYETAREAWVAAEREEVARYQTIRAQERKVRRRLADKRRAAATKAAQRKRELRHAGPKDSDARSMEKKGRFEGGLKQGSRDIQLLRGEAERLGEAAAGFDLHRQLGGDLYFDYEPAHRRVLLSYAGELSVTGNVLVADVDVSVHRADRILLAGPNGAGKSTLLQRLLAGSTLPANRVLYLPQELTGADTSRLLEAVTALDPKTKGRVLGIVGLLGSDPERILSTNLPSPGEARKLLIASGLGAGAWVLLLDEPTNHLDLPSIERLETAITAFPGAVLVVTHDDTFGRQTTDSLWTIADGALTVGSG